jgi:hypothetical protein
VTLRTILTSRIKLLTCTQVILPSTDEEQVRRYMIERAARDIAETLFKHNKVLISKRDIPEGIFFHLAVEVIVPEVTYDETDH